MVDGAQSLARHRVVLVLRSCMLLANAQRQLLEADIVYQMVSMVKMVRLPVQGSPLAAHVPPVKFVEQLPQQLIIHQDVVAPII